jgi:hypothetical protein
VLHAASGVIERYRLDFRMLAEKIAALIERYGMRKCAAQRSQLHPRSSDHVVHDPEQILALDEHVSGNQKIRVLGHGSGQRIFNGDHGRVDRSPLDSIENLRGSRTRHDGAARQHTLRGLVAERSTFPLDGNFHLEQNIWKRVEEQIGETEAVTFADSAKLVVVQTVASPSSHAKP